MLLEYLAVGAGGCRKALAHESRHDLAQDGGMIFRLGLSLRALNSEPCEALAQARQRSLMQEAGEIIRAVREEFAATEPDEQIEVLALDALGAGAARRLGKGGV